MSGTSVPVTFLIDGPKITAYLLNPQHTRGGSKAKYLLRFGFKLAEPQLLADALAAHALGNLPGTVQPQPIGPNRIRFEGVVRAPGRPRHAAGDGMGSERSEWRAHHALHHRHSADPVTRPHRESGGGSKARPRPDLLTGRGSLRSHQR